MDAGTDTPCAPDLVYPPLDVDSRQIRLLEILDNQERIECVLETYDVSEADEYIALSYTWGSDDASHVITINDCDFRVRKNLFDFLSFARQSLPGELLWIDQICIDQNNVREKNHQVRFMSKIYKNAESVVAWLGAAENDSDFAMDYLASPLPDPESDNTPRLEKALMSLFSRPYWSRQWIVQELKLARSAMFFCGEQWVTGSDFRDFIPFGDTMEMDVRGSHPVVHKLFAGKISQYGRPSYNAVDPSEPYAPPILLDINEEEKKEAADLLRTIYLYCNHQCVDSRDKVYGLLGLSSEPESIMKVDYTKTAAELFWDVVNISVSVIPVSRKGGDGDAMHVTLGELIDRWAHFFAKLSIEMNVATETLLEATAVELGKTFEALQEARITKGI
ncbi:HET-domain-containing protein [Bimuria novae-zelandiae CBS 107.79]|uniref:HET-domain-containing protein n=1 Tax=Bimuria novae-zelandiae CBS 107.79 TaxID=1447943 RepID=A0A6A5VHU6_9PLEO|nr:HET-domain-containing protein [Bimuria novae-zelandiae CBS 107.79]